MSGGVAESVFIAGLFTLAATEFAAIAALCDRSDDADSYRTDAEKMALVTAEHGWDGEWFLRAYDHFGNPVGSARDTEGQIFIEPQGICVMAGIGRHPAGRRPAGAGYAGSLLEEATARKKKSKQSSGFTATRRFRGATYEIAVRRSCTQNESGIAEGAGVFVDGKQIVGTLLPLAPPGKTVCVEVVIPAA